MFLQLGSFDKVLNPGIGSDRSVIVNLGRPVTSKLYVVLNGFDIGYANHDNHILRVQVDLRVIHTSGASTAEVRCRFRFRDDDATDGDTIWTQADFLLIAE
jgi:hypothetical protein